MLDAIMRHDGKFTPRSILSSSIERLYKSLPEESKGAVYKANLMNEAIILFTEEDWDEVRRRQATGGSLPPNHA